MILRKSKEIHLVLVLVQNNTLLLYVSHPTYFLTKHLNENHSFLSLQPNLLFDEDQI